MSTETNGSGTGMTIKEMLGGLQEDLKRVEGKLNKVDTALQVHIAEARGERSGGDRTWKVLAAVAGLPGIGALIALITGQPTN